MIHKLWIILKDIREIRPKNLVNFSTLESTNHKKLEEYDSEGEGSNFNASTEDAIVNDGGTDHETETKNASDANARGCSEHPVELFAKPVDEDNYKGAENESISSENNTKQFEAGNDELDLNAEEFKELLDDCIRRSRLKLSE